MELTATVARKMGMKKICIMLYDKICLHIMETLNGGGV